MPPSGPDACGESFTWSLPKYEKPGVVPPASTQWAADADATGMPARAPAMTSPARSFLVRFMVQYIPLCWLASGRGYLGVHTQGDLCGISRRPPARNSPEPLQRGTWYLSKGQLVDVHARLLTRQRDDGAGKRHWMASSALIEHIALPVQASSRIGFTIASDCSTSAVVNPRPGAASRYMLIPSTKRLRTTWRSSSEVEQGTHKPLPLNAVVPPSRRHHLPPSHALKGLPAEGEMSRRGA